MAKVTNKPIKTPTSLSLTKSNSSVDENDQRNKALADALAGVAASLLSLWVFYPIDVWITNVQAFVVPKDDHDDDDDDNLHDQSRLSKDTSTLEKDKRRIPLEKRQSSILDQMPSSVSQMLAGWKIKTLHTSCSSFCYFYLYSWIFTLYRQHKRSRLLLKNSQKQQQQQQRDSVATSTRLLLTAIAAMMNTILTLPLDVLASQQQNHQKQEQQKYDKKSSIKRDLKTDTIFNSDDDTNNNSTHHSLHSNDSYVFQTSSSSHGTCTNITVDTSDRINMKIVIDEANNKNKPQDDDNGENTSIDSFHSTKESFVHITKNVTNKKQIQNTSIKNDNSLIIISRILSLWRGLVPSLILSSNPAINYTVYETCKAQLLLHKQSDTSSKTSSVSMKDAFVLGLISKFVATIVTYPIIKAKVILMVQNENVHGNTKHNSNSSSLLSLWHVLRNEYKHGGIVSGLYRGCSLQLLHTLLKSALLMMFRERITRTTYNLLLPSPTQQSAPR